MKPERRASPSPEPLAVGQQVELVCLKVGFDAIRSQVPPHGPTVIVRTGRSEIRPVPGELFMMEVDRSWIFGRTRYAKGLITASRLEVPTLDLELLGLTACGLWDPEEETELFDEPDHPVYEAIRGAGPRPQYEMEQVLPEDIVELHWEDDPIVEAAELAAAGARDEADDLLGDLLTADLRCLDAHAHLGHFEFRSAWPGALDRAGRHYRAGLAIAGLTLGDNFQGLLPWGLIDNRPYLRCLEGFGLYLWRSGDLAGAVDVFRRMLWLNPHDNQGARFNLADVEAARSWEEVTAEEDRS